MRVVMEQTLRAYILKQYQLRKGMHQSIILLKQSSKQD